MTMNRRSFVRFAGLAGPGVLLALPSSALGSRWRAGEGGTETVVLVDGDLCAGCGVCQAACARGGRFSVPSTSSGLLQGAQVQPASLVRRCGGCRDASCVAACRSGALAPAAGGGVSFDSSRCSGCGSCVSACGSPQRASAPVAMRPEGARCDRCLAAGAGRSPACASACPAGAISVTGRPVAGPVRPEVWPSGLAAGAVAVLGVIALRRRREDLAPGGTDGE